MAGTASGATLNIHATCVALAIGGAWQGVLLRGPSGAGKSDLAIRLVDEGARLVADDRTELSLEAGSLTARPPPVLAGLVEARGIGLLRVPPENLLATAPVRLIVDLVAAADIERLPEPQFETLLEVRVPRICLPAFDASTSAKIRLALTATRAT
jgi:serine kinase of HPr protein (carbohydrate metabolism regulator)